MSLYEYIFILYIINTLSIMNLQDNIIITDLNRLTGWKMSTYLSKEVKLACLPLLSKIKHYIIVFNLLAALTKSWSQIKYKYLSTITIPFITMKIVKKQKNVIVKTQRQMACFFGSDRKM